ncbi:protein of unknown function [Mesotoga infera]|uniref:Uncharacterized protein n=1 Tax=Mesotoga infera TaxID=1236046 RepID=A0A7Z7PNC5_9BACT|nr:protein of unknown function [Mesotoga infera]
MRVIKVLRGISTKLNKPIGILRKMELTQIEETQSDATISIAYEVLRLFL